MEDRDLTKTEEWFRAKLHETVGYGLTAITIIGGWLISSDSIISIHHAEDAEKREAALFLAILLPLLWAAWYVVLRNLHTRLPAHSTIVRRRNLHLLAWGGLVVVALIWCLAADVIAVPAQFDAKKP
jgi:hypothetical protein